MKAYYDKVIGERYCRIDKEILMKYNNVGIYSGTVEQFIQYLKDKGLFSIPEIRIYFRKTKADLFGFSNSQPIFIIELYRHSVAIFLHELAHIIEYYKNPNQFSNFHGKAFGITLTDLYTEYLKEVKE